MQMTKRLLGLLILTALLLAGGILLWLGWPSQDLLLRGRQALDREDRYEVERLATALELADRPDHARLLRGLAYVHEGRERMKRAGEFNQQDATEQTLLLGLDVLGRGCTASIGNPSFGLFEPRMLRGVALLRPRRGEQEHQAARAREAFRQARAELRGISETSEAFEEAALLSGECFYHVGEVEKAVSAFRVVLGRNAEHPDAHRWLAAAYLDLNAVQQAAEHLRALGRLNPEDGRAYRQLGRIYRDYRQHELAIQAYRQALTRRLDPTSFAEVALELAELLAEQGRHAEAEEALRRVPAEQSDGARCLTIFSAVARERGRRADAVTLVETALRHDPDWARALLLRATLHLDAGEDRSAAQLLERAVCFEPHDQSIREQLAQAYERLDDRERAQVHWRLKEESHQLQTQLTALNRDAVLRPWDEGIRFQLAQLWLRMDRPAEARTWLRAVLSCDPGHEEAQKMLARLDGLRNH